MANSYSSPGKTYNRGQWRHFCLRLVHRLRRSLNAVWLSGPEFEDLIPMLDVFRSVSVPELDPTEYVAKKRFLAAHPELSMIRLTHEPMLATVRTLAREGTAVDIINLDLCTHFCPDVESTLAVIFHGHVLRSNGLLFLTVARHAYRNKGPLQGRSLATKTERVQEQVDADAALAGWTCDVLPGYPKPYAGRGDCPMLSFGWACRLLTTEKRTMTFTKSEKNAIVALRKAGVAANVLAQAFQVPTQAIAAVVAHNTRRSKAGAA